MFNYMYGYYHQLIRILVMLTRGPLLPMTRTLVAPKYLRQSSFSSNDSEDGKCRKMRVLLPAAISDPGI